jgi:hypothetical protein
VAGSFRITRQDGYCVDVSKEQEVRSTYIVSGTFLNFHSGSTRAKDWRAGHDRLDIGSLGSCHRERGTLSLHPRRNVLKDIPGNISFLAQLHSMESPRVAGFGPNGMVTPSPSALTHES